MRLPKGWKMRKVPSDTPGTARFMVSFPSVVHRCPPEGSGLFPCCGRTPFEVPGTDRMSLVADDVNCPGVPPEGPTKQKEPFA